MKTAIFRDIFCINIRLHCIINLFTVVYFETTVLFALNKHKLPFAFL